MGGGMTRDEIIERMGWELSHKIDAVTVGTNSLLDRIERIVVAAVAAERERCAKIVEENYKGVAAACCADQIRGKA